MTDDYYERNLYKEYYKSYGDDLTRSQIAKEIKDKQEADSWNSMNFS